MFVSITVDTLSTLGTQLGLSSYRYHEYDGILTGYEHPNALRKTTPPRLRLGSGVTITFGGGGRDVTSSHLCPQPHRFALIPSIGLIGPPWQLFYWFYIGTSNNGPLPPPSSSANEERWIPAGSFAQSFLVAAI
jgi:hypothetical protein